jgi:hypothetical protein
LSKKRPLAGKPAALVPKTEDRLLADVRKLILDAREQTADAINAVLTLTYWHVGDRIRRDLLKMKRADYGEQKPDKLIAAELRKLREEDRLTPEMVFRDPYFLDFLGLKDTYSEKDLEATMRKRRRNTSTSGRKAFSLPNTAPSCRRANCLIYRKAEKSILFLFSVEQVANLLNCA